MSCWCAECGQPKAYDAHNTGCSLAPPVEAT